MTGHTSDSPPDQTSPPALTDALTQSLSARFNCPLTLEPLQTITPQTDVADASLKFLARARQGRPVAFVLCASAVSPGSVSRSLARMLEIQQLLGPDLGRVILQPLAQGTVCDRSFAAMPLCQNVADFRPYWYLQRLSLRPAILCWLRKVTAHTLAPVPTDQLTNRFIHPLEHLSSLTQISPALRQAAADALSRLHAGSWQPRYVLAHNDLWAGNILLRKSVAPSCFIGGYPRLAVIDWGAAVVQGYAIYDLVRLGMALNCKGYRFQRQLRAHCRILECNARDAQSYLATALGHLSLNLGHVPFDRFQSLAHDCLAWLQRYSPPLTHT
ncbi:MAG: phosphotransferase [Phycisphaeraceae bacterium]|nr:phosphotransferase [Phycisphaeraceae bacterium]